MNHSSSVSSALVSALVSLVAVATPAGCGFASSPDPQTMPDGGATHDGASPDGDVGDLVQLTETAGDEIAPQSSVTCYAPGAQSTEDQTWVRTFRLSDWNHPGAFQVSTVTFWVTDARSARGILVGLGTYGGPFGGATIDPDLITPLASVTIDVDDVAAPLPPKQVAPPISAEIGAGQVLVVAVRSPSLRSVSGSLHIGATNAAEATPGYFASTACSIPYRSTQALGISGHLAIEVVGRWLTR